MHRSAPTRFTPFLLIPALTGLLYSACTEDCGEVECAPSPPAVTVVVYDSIEYTDTVLYEPTVDARVTLYVDAGAALVNGVEVPARSLDTLFVLTNAIDLQSGAELFGIVAERGEKKDTLRNLSLKRTGGCCPQTLLGWFTIRL